MFYFQLKLLLHVADKQSKMKPKIKEPRAALEKSRKMVEKIKELDEKLITVSKEKGDSALTSASMHMTVCLNVVFILNENELYFYILRNKIWLQMLRSAVTS